MIVGIGTDIVEIRRMTDYWRRHGERGLEKMLAEDEREACRQSPHPDRYLAKRFAAKEALGKALGTGIRGPLVLPAISVIHDALGKPAFALSGGAADLLVRDGQRLACHLSLSDEQDYAVAFVVVETV